MQVDITNCYSQSNQTEKCKQKNYAFQRSVLCVVANVDILEILFSFVQLANVMVTSIDRKKNLDFLEISLTFLLSTKVMIMVHVICCPELLSVLNDINKYNEKVETRYLLLHFEKEKPRKENGRNRCKDLQSSQ